VYVPPREPEPESVQESDSSPELSEGDISDIVETPVCPSRVVTLPMPLAQTNSGSMTSVSREYFPAAEFVFPGIYTLPNDSGYILFCVDNSRYSNSGLKISTRGPGRLTCLFVSILNVGNVI